MRYLIATVLALATLAPPAQAAVLKVFACEPEWAALALEIGGERVETFAATTAQQDPHQVQPRPSLIARFRNADLVICTGAELESGWLPVLVQTAGNARVRPGSKGWFEASTFVTLREVPATLDRAQGDLHASGNPHIQTDARHFLPIGAALAQRFADIDPAGAAHYGARKTAFETRWRAAIARWEVEAKPLRGVRVVGFHKEWSYLNAWLGIEQVATLEPKPGIPPGAAHLNLLLGQLKREPARMILHSPFQDERPGRWLAQHSGIVLVELPFTIGGAAGTDDLMAMFQRTIDALLSGATAEP